MLQNSRHQIQDVICRSLNIHNQGTLFFVFFYRYQGTLKVKRRKKCNTTKESRQGQKYDIEPGI